MTPQDIAAAKAARKSTLKSLKAKRESRINAIQEKAAEEIRQVNIEFAADPERMKAKYAADAAYKSERAKKRAAKAQERAEKRIAWEIEQKKNERVYSFGEEVFNSVTIGIGAGLSVAALILLIIKANSSVQSSISGRTMVSCILIGSFLFAMYLMSTLAHALRSYTAKSIFRILSFDFGYFYIASILSFLALVIVGNSLGWGIFGLIWIVAIFAVSFYSSMGAKPQAKHFGMKICLLITIAVTIFELVKLFSISAVAGKFIVLAICSYVIGELFHLMKRVPWTNPIFHLFGIIANVFCFFALYFIL